MEPDVVFMRRCRDRINGGDVTRLELVLFSSGRMFADECGRLMAAAFEMADVGVLPTLSDKDSLRC